MTSLQSSPSTALHSIVTVSCCRRRPCSSGLKLDQGVHSPAAAPAAATAPPLLACSRSRLCTRPSSRPCQRHSCPLPAKHRRHAGHPLLPCTLVMGLLRSLVCVASVWTDGPQIAWAPLCRGFSGSCTWRSPGAAAGCAWPLLLGAVPPWIAPAWSVALCQTCPKLQRQLHLVVSWQRRQLCLAPAAGRCACPVWQPCVVSAPASWIRSQRQLHLMVFRRRWRLSSGSAAGASCRFSPMALRILSFFSSCSAELIRPCKHPAQAAGASCLVCTGYVRALLLCRADQARQAAQLFHVLSSARRALPIRLYPAHTSSCVHVLPRCVQGGCTAASTPCACSASAPLNLKGHARASQRARCA